MTLRLHLGPLLSLAAFVCVYFVLQLTTGTVQFDGVDVHYSLQRYFSDAIRGGHLPFWTPFLFAGFPFLADLQVGAWYPLNWPFFVLGITPSSMSFELLLHTLIACVRASHGAVRYSAKRSASFAGEKGAVVRTPTGMRLIGPCNATIRCEAGFHTRRHRRLERRPDAVVIRHRARSLRQLAGHDPQPVI